MFKICRKDETHVARRGLTDALVGTLAEAFGDGDETVSGALEALNRVCNDLMTRRSVS